MLYISTDNSTQLSKNPSWIQNIVVHFGHPLWISVCLLLVSCRESAARSVSLMVTTCYQTSALCHEERSLLSFKRIFFMIYAGHFFFPFFLSPYQIAAVWALYLPDLQTVFCIFFPCSLFSLVTKSAKVLDNIKHLISIQGTVSALT